MQYLWICAALAFLLGRVLIPILRRLKFGQEIREEGPKWHEKKSGTPTMGGFIFLIAMVIALSAAMAAGNALGEMVPGVRPVLMLVVVTLAFAAIGFLDDYIKVILKRNLGLTASQKFGLQFLVALAYVSWAVFGKNIDTVVRIPFTEASWNLGWFFIPFAVIVILATVNSVNLTDGLDGLATSVTLAVAVFFLLVSTVGRLFNPAVALFSSAMVGGLLGFLLYNKYPAKVFMGDTGSLALGGAVCGMAILLEEPLALLIVGFVYVMESLSVIMQVTSYQLTGKRIFKMSPIHHHFEMCGMSERKIVAMFTAVTVVLCALMYFFG